MNIIVTCPDYRRRIALVAEKPGSSPVPGTIKIGGADELVRGLVVSSEGLEFKFILSH